jgi:hypothetical protein
VAIKIDLFDFCHEVGEGCMKGPWVMATWSPGSWKPIRTTNPIESTFATVRHRTGKAPRQTKKGDADKLIIWLGLMRRSGFYDNQ